MSKKRVNHTGRKKIDAKRIAFCYIARVRGATRSGRERRKPPNLRGSRVSTALRARAGSLRNSDVPDCLGGAQTVPRLSSSTAQEIILRIR